jgi:hypothetical protein
VKSTRKEFELIAHCIAWCRFVFKLARLLGTPVWRAADHAVAAVLECGEIERAVRFEERTAFCPRCGQIPDGDRRMDEAREVFEAIWGTRKPPKRSQLDFALACAYFRRKSPAASPVRTGSSGASAQES